MAAACSDPGLLATDAAEALVQDGVPFRDAHEQVAASVRDGSYEAPEAGARPAPGPGGVHEALREAAERFA
jgi:argininosuccinate lyase